MSKSDLQRELSGRQADELIGILRARFGRHTGRHHGVEWSDVQARLEARPDRLWSLGEMERTGGEPDVVGTAAGEFVFMDCSPESPAGRRSVCYDREGLESRKAHHPKTTAVDLAGIMGINLLTEREYLALQELGEFDTKTSQDVELDRHPDGFSSPRRGALGRPELRSRVPRLQRRAIVLCGARLSGISAGLSGSAAVAGPGPPVVGRRTWVGQLRARRPAQALGMDFPFPKRGPPLSCARFSAAPGQNPGAAL
jgi:hypothetical protein